MKKEYVGPRMVGEKFVANEYVAACWGVGCDTSAAEIIEKELKNSPFNGHRSNQCGKSSHQYIVTNSAGAAERMEERGNDYFPTLQCTLYTDATYQDEMDIAEVDPGETIYWVTKGGRYTYHHVGIVTETYPGHPNRS